MSESAESLAAVAVAACAGSIIYSLTGFGSSVMFLSLWSLFALAGIDGAGSIPEAVVYTTLQSTAIGWGQFYHLRGPARRWDMAVALAVGQLPAALFGYDLLYSVDARVLERGLGSLFLLVVAWKVWVGRRPSADPKDDEEEEEDDDDADSSIADCVVHQRFDMTTWPRRLAVVAAGAVSGFVGGFLGAKGPVLMVFVSVMGIDPQEWRATTPAMGLMVSAPKAAYLLAFKADIPADWALRFPLAVTASLLGLGLGNVLARFVRKAVIQWIVGLLLLLSGGLLLSDGDQRVAGGMVVVGVVVWAGQLLWAKRRVGDRRGLMLVNRV